MRPSKIPSSACSACDPTGSCHGLCCPLHPAGALQRVGHGAPARCRAGAAGRCLPARRGPVLQKHPRHAQPPAGGRTPSVVRALCRRHFAQGGAGRRAGERPCAAGCPAARGRGPLGTADSLVQAGPLERHARLHRHARHSGIAAVCGHAGACVQPRHAPPGPDHCRIDRAGPALPRAGPCLLPAKTVHAMSQNLSITQTGAVVLAAEGPAFCAGANLNWMRRMADYTRDENIADAGKLAEMLRVIYECPKPTVARVQGDVYAGGMGLVAACDMAVAVDTAGFCLSEVKLGLIPATISPYVIRAMGARAAHRYFLTAERFGAAEALRIGFVHEVVVADQLDTKVDELLKALTSASPNAVRVCKKLVRDVAEREINAGLIAATVQGIADIRASDEGKEGVQSFLNKRKPNWLS